MLPSLDRSGVVLPFSEGLRENPYLRRLTKPAALRPSSCLTQGHRDLPSAMGGVWGLQPGLGSHPCERLGMCHIL